MSYESETSTFKRFGAGSVVMAVILFSFAAFILSGSMSATFGLLSMLWFSLGMLAFTAGQFINRLEARIKVLEKKLSEAEALEIPVVSSTGN
jgi:hypothetical protein